MTAAGERDDLHAKLDRLGEPEVALAAIARLDHQRLMVAAWLAVTTGARRGELVGLRWRDVDLEAGVVRFGGAVAVGPDGLVRKSTKSGRPKVLAMDPASVELLRDWRKVVATDALRFGVGVAEAGPVFPSPSDPSVPWHPGQVTLQWHRFRGTVGLEGLRFHDLRHRTPRCSWVRGCG